MHFEIDRRSSIEVYMPYLIVSVFLPLMTGNYLMTEYLITGMLRYYITLNIIVFGCLVVTILLITIMVMKYTQIDKNPSVEWLYSMGAIQYTVLNDAKLMYIQDIVFIDMVKKGKGIKVTIYTDYKDTRLHFTKEGYVHWKDFLDNYIVNLEIPVDLNGGNYYGRD